MILTVVVTPVCTVTVIVPLTELLLVAVMIAVPAVTPLTVALFGSSSDGNTDTQELLDDHVEMTSVLTELLASVRRALTNFSCPILR